MDWGFDTDLLLLINGFHHPFFLSYLQSLYIIIIISMLYIEKENFIIILYTKSN